MHKLTNTLGWVVAIALTAALGVQVLATDRTQQVTPPATDTNKAITDLQQRVAELERDKKAADDAFEKLEDLVDTLDQDADNLAKRVEQIDRNDLPKMTRDLRAMGQAIEDLKRRVRILE